MRFSNPLHEQTLLEHYEDIDHELLERITEMELEYLFPDKSWDSLSPETQTEIIQENSYLSDYFIQVDTLQN